LLWRGQQDKDIAPGTSLGIIGFLSIEQLDSANLPHADVFGFKGV
jgi:hypothetical protein